MTFTVGVTLLTPFAAFPDLLHIGFLERKSVHTANHIAYSPPKFEGYLAAVSTSIKDVDFKFAIPGAGAIIAGALLLVPFGISTLQILRKNRRHLPRQ